MKKVIVIVGPTASGKTNLSIRLALAMNGEIINGDSVQVYKGLDIGSAKIKDHEKKGIPHHLLDIREAGQQYTVYDFQQDARHLIDQIDVPILTGGTGFYIKAVLYDYDFAEAGRSHAFDLRYQHVSTTDLYEELRVLDPKLTIDVNNRRRVLRALEQAQTGYFRSQKNQKDVCLYDVLTLYLDIDRPTLEQRLIQRLEQQLDDGFIQEVQTLKDRGIVVDAIGYREIGFMLDGMMSLAEAKQEIITATKRLAKKQKTWFKNQMSPVILDALSLTLEEDAIAIAKSFMMNRSTK